MIALIHSSKTMRTPPASSATLRRPQLIEKASELSSYLKTLPPTQLAKVMRISPLLAQKTYRQIKDWSSDPEQQSLAIDSFVGDIYSGLQANELSTEDREYADQILRILSGLYGILRPLDGISPYRLEMGYKLPRAKYSNLYRFWGRTIIEALPTKGIIVNTSSAEYSKVVLPFVDAARVLTPQFFTIHPKTNKPTFIVVHAKIARGAYARWLIRSRADDQANFTGFTELGYKFDPRISTPGSPAFVCRAFGGTGLSLRLK